MQSLEDYARRITKLERELALNSSQRKLGQTAIGGGGLRVHDGGEIRIEDDGHLVIESGNLVLANGAIEGQALNTQIVTEFYSKTANVYGDTSWRTGVEVEVSVPEWATTTTVQLAGNGFLRTYGEIRATVDGKPSTAVGANEWASGFDDRYTESLVWAGVVAGKRSFRCSIDMRELGYGFPTGTSGNRLTLAVTAIHYR